MIREEEIKVSALKYLDIFIPDVYGIGHGDIYEAFMAGVDWADKHPKSPWISVEDDLPCNNPNNIHFGFTNRVLVIDKKGNLFVAYMKKSKDNKWIWESTHDFAFLNLITHWIPIPKLPKE